MNTLIVPAAGKSSRFPNMRPKWLLTQPNGRLMLVDSISKLSNYDQVYIILLKQHIEKHNVDINYLKKELREVISNDIPIYVDILDQPTKSQCETVVSTIKKHNISGPIFIKDCDNIFEHKIEPINHVCYINIDGYNIKNITNKSFLTFTPLKNITNIAEKNVISDNICVGGYGFTSAKLYLDKYNYLFDSNIDELYSSHIIYALMLDENIFTAVEVEDYVDFGRYDDWLNYKKEFKTLFIDIDGVLIKNGGKESWGDLERLDDNVSYLMSLKRNNKTQIILTTARSEEYREVTEKQLRDNGIEYDQLVMGLYHCKRYLINDYSKTNPYPTAIALNLKRDIDKLEYYI